MLVSGLELSGSVGPAVRIPDLGSSALSFQAGGGATAELGWRPVRHLRVWCALNGTWLYGDGWRNNFSNVSLVLGTDVIVPIERWTFFAGLSTGLAEVHVICPSSHSFVGVPIVGGRVGGELPVTDRLSVGVALSLRGYTIGLGALHPVPCGYTESLIVWGEAALRLSFAL